MKVYIKKQSYYYLHIYFKFFKDKIEIEGEDYEVDFNFSSLTMYKRGEKFFEVKRRSEKDENEYRCYMLEYFKGYYNPSENFIEEFKKEVEDWKRVSQKRLDEINEIISEIKSILEKERLISDDNIEFFDNYGLGFRYRGCRNVGFWLELVNIRNDRVFPSSTSEFGKFWYIANNFNAPIKCMDAIETLEAIKNIPCFVERVKEKIVKLRKDYEKGGENNENN